MAISTELMGPGWFIFFQEEETGSAGRAGQARRARAEDIREDDEDFFKLIAEAMPGILKYLRR